MAPTESVTRTRNLFVPLDFALPEIAPDFDSASPLGSDPFDRFHV